MHLVNVILVYLALVLPRLLLLGHPLLFLLLPPLGAPQLLALRVRERRRLLVPEEAVAAVRAPDGGCGGGGRGGGPADGHPDGRGGGGVAAVGRAEGRRRRRRVRGSAGVAREDHGEVHPVVDGLPPPPPLPLLLFLLFLSLLLLLLVSLLRDDVSPVQHDVVIVIVGDVEHRVGARLPAAAVAGGGRLGHPGGRRSHSLTLPCPLSSALLLLRSRQSHVGSGWR